MGLICSGCLLPRVIPNVVAVHAGYVDLCRTGTHAFTDMQTSCRRLVNNQSCPAVCLVANTTLASQPHYSFSSKASAHLPLCFIEALNPHTRAAASHRDPTPTTANPGPRQQAC